MAASPEFYKHCSAPAFSSPCGSPRVLFGGGVSDLDDFSCRTPQGAKISYLREPGTCPPAPRKPRPPPAACKKRLFEVTEVLSLRMDELERLFRPCPPSHCDTKRRRWPDNKSG